MNKNRTVIEAQKKNNLTANESHLYIITNKPHGLFLSLLFFKRFTTLNDADGQKKTHHCKYNRFLRSTQNLKSNY